MPLATLRPLLLVLSATAVGIGLTASACDRHQHDQRPLAQSSRLAPR